MGFDGFDGKHLPPKAIKNHQRHRRLTLGSDPLLSTSHDRLSQQGLTPLLSTRLLSGRYIVPKLIVALCHREQRSFLDHEAWTENDLAFGLNLIFTALGKMRLSESHAILLADGRA